VHGLDARTFDTTVWLRRRPAAPGRRPAPVSARGRAALVSTGGVLFGELGFGLSNHQDREDDHRQQAEAEQHPV
jgi:hypothetical protein